MKDVEIILIMITVFTQVVIVVVWANAVLSGMANFVGNEKDKRQTKIEIIQE